MPRSTVGQIPPLLPVAVPPPVLCTLLHMRVRCAPLYHLPSRRIDGASSLTRFECRMRRRSAVSRAARSNEDPPMLVHSSTSGEHLFSLARAFLLIETLASSRHALRFHLLVPQFVEAAVAKDRPEGLPAAGPPGSAIPSSAVAATAAAAAAPAGRAAVAAASHEAAAAAMRHSATHRCHRRRQRHRRNVASCLRAGGTCPSLAQEGCLQRKSGNCAVGHRGHPPARRHQIHQVRHHRRYVLQKGRAAIRATAVRCHRSALWSSRSLPAAYQDRA